MSWRFGKTSLMIKNLKIYNLIRWLTGKAGQKTDRPSISFISLFLIDFGHSKLFKDKLKQFFSLDELTGEIWSKIMFDREQQATYEVPITATDVGGKNGFCVLKVIIEDVNDNHPQFNLDEYKANIKNTMRNN